MKKVLMISALVMMIVASMVSGTLALYTTTIAPFSGSVVAKEFVLLSAGNAAFSTDVKIAPSETKDKIFTVTNSNGTVTTEVNMSVNITLAFAGITAGKQIQPLTVEVYDGATLLTSAAIGTLTNGIGTLTINNVSLPANTATTKTYTVKFTWPSSVNDTAYAGNAFGTKLTVSVVGVQAP